MTALTAFFQALLDLSLTALPVMGAVLLARFCLRPAPKKYSYVLWAVVAFRLVCPVSLPSPMSLFNSAPVQTAQETAQSVIREFGQTAIPLLSDHTAHSTPAAPQNAPEAITTMTVSPMEVLALLWVVGLSAMLVWAVISDLRIRRNVAQAVRLEDGVFQCDGLKTPFVLGFFRPKIYVPFRMEPGELAHILLHERTHLRRSDPWWKLLGFGILTVYWWNPAVWLCHNLFCRDMEMSCDEAVLQKLGPEVKQLYSLSLVSFAAGRHFPATGPLAFGENDAKPRVKNILRWKRAVPAAAFLATALCLVAAVICGTNAPVGRGWAQTSGTVSAGGRTALEFSYSVPGDINSCLFYEDVYDHGELVARNPVCYFDFIAEANHAPRRGTASLAGYMDTGFSSGGWHFSLPIDGGNVGYPYPSALPQRDYRALVGPAYPGQNGDKTRRALSELDVVGVLTLSDDDGKLSGAGSVFENFSPAALFADGLTDVAAVLRVEFSRLGSEELRQEFLSNGPGAGAAQDGNQITVKGTSAGVGVDFTVELAKPVRSWAIYEDVYDHGVLVSSIPRISDGFLEDGTGVTSRNFSGTLTCQISYDGTGTNFGNALHCSYGETGSPAMAEWTVGLPAAGYNGAGMIPGYIDSLDGRKSPTKKTFSLADAHEAVLLTYLFSETTTGFTVYQVGKDPTQINDGAVRFRLVTSVESGSGSLSSSAMRLYALKNPYIGDAAADGKLLNALGIGDFGDYKLELFTAERPYILQINFQNEPSDPDALDAAMFEPATLLLALIDNLEEVRWTYPKTQDGKPTLVTVYFKEDNALCPAGMTTKDCGANLQNLQTLLDYLGVETSAANSGS